MPIINGMKMACEPCIRGHRSTKCTHANERLMVPVKKPGRPLTACPHLQPQTCGCSSITAAIPRKSQCGCGGASKTIKSEPQPAASSTTPEAPSPTAPNFKIKKASQAKSRKQSYDANMLGRIDPNSVNVIPFTSQRPPQLIAPALPNGSKPAVPQVPYFNENQNAPYHQTQTPLTYGTGSPYISSNGNGGYPLPNGNGVNGLYMPLESLPESIISSRSNSTGPSSCCGPKNGIKLEYDTQEPEPSRSSCCSKDSSETPIDGMVFANENVSPILSTGNGAHAMTQFSFPTTYPVNPPLYNAYPTVYAYPPSYGSYQNPLQPSEWRQSVINNMYAQPSQPLTSLNDHMSDLFPMQTADLDLNTLHSCGCGETCQCIGCAAHPYNDATQEYVRSAYRGLREPHTPSMSGFPNHNTYDVAPNAVFASTNAGYGGGNGEDEYVMGGQGKFAVHSNGENQDANRSLSHSRGGSLGNSPLSEGEEQTLEASDFFFVRYPISGEGCGGDTTSCPCGDECRCLGCTIHRGGESMGGGGVDGGGDDVVSGGVGVGTSLQIGAGEKAGGWEVVVEVGAGTGTGGGGGGGGGGCCR